MLLVLIGTVLIILKVAEVGPFADLSNWWIAVPFATIVLWWAFADSSGLTQRNAMQKMEDKKVKRRERAMEALGLNTRRARRLESIRSAKRRAQTPEERESLSPDANEDGRRREP